MSLAVIEDLAQASGELRTAMQKADLGDIETAMLRFRTAIEAVQAVGSWRADPQIKARVKDLMGELDSSRTLACILGDMSGQMHASVASQNLDIPQPIYGPGR